VHRGGYDSEQHLEDMALDGVAGEVLYPSQGLFHFKVADTLLMSAIFRAYNDWLAEFCRTDPARLKGIAMINLDDVQDGIKELERTARLGLYSCAKGESLYEHCGPRQGGDRERGAMPCPASGRWRQELSGGGRPENCRNLMRG
jgi:hypothetical protein